MARKECYTIIGKQNHSRTQQWRQTFGFTRAVLALFIPDSARLGWYGSRISVFVLLYALLHIAWKRVSVVFIFSRIVAPSFDLLTSTTNNNCGWRRLGTMRGAPKGNNGSLTYVRGGQRTHTRLKVFAIRVATRVHRCPPAPLDIAFIISTLALM